MVAALPMIGARPEMRKGRVHVSASRRRAPARLRRPEPRARLAMRDVPKGALRTHSA